MQKRLSSSVPVEIRRQFGNPNAFSGRTTTPCDSSSSKMRMRLLSDGQLDHDEIGFRWHHRQSQFPQPFGESTRRPRAFNSSERCRNSLSASAAIPAACAGVDGSNGSFTLSRLRISSSCANPYPMRDARQSIGLGERAQRDHVVVAIVHGIGIARIVLGVFEVGFVQDDQHPLRNVLVELVELVAREDGAGGIVGIGQVNDLGVLVDLLRQAPAGRNASRDRERCDTSRRASAPAPESR